jgi:hypothetical protein
LGKTKGIPSLKNVALFHLPLGDPMRFFVAISKFWGIAGSFVGPVGELVLKCQ